MTVNSLAGPTGSARRCSGDGCTALARSRGMDRRSGKQIRRPLCGSCGHKKKYRRHLVASCAKCGFRPEHRCQLDIDHIDGNKKNGAPGNLQTLCANCHRLKTWKERHP